MTESTYVARDPDCGHIVWAVVNESADNGPNHDAAKWKRRVAKTVGQMVRDGLAVSLVETQVVRNEGFCPCRRKKEPSQQVEAFA